MAVNLTEIEQKILDYMVSYLRGHTYQPSIREIGEQFGIRSTKTVSEHLQALADKGFVERDPARSRGVKILGMDLDPQTLSVPCYVGLPKERSGLRADRAERYFTLDRRLAGSKGCFFVQMTDEALAPLGIAEGDFVLIESTLVEDVEDGSVIVVHVDRESGFYRLSRNGTGVFLRGLRNDSEPLFVEDPSRLALMGRVTSFYRRLPDAATATDITPH